MTYKGIIISDIHVGAFSLEQLLKEYREIFLEYISKMEQLDFLIVTGDFFDRKFFLNDKEASISYLMLKELLEICKEKNTVVRFVYGTDSHEANQYDILSLLKIYEKVKIIKYVESEELLEDLHVLYLPEEYMINQEEYYKPFFSRKKYDYVFGHGIIREVMKEASVRKESKHKRKQVPVFTTAGLEKITRGQCFFGHYHIHQEITEKVIYIGSFSRWQFGEEDAKGFYEVECNPKKSFYEKKFLENTMAESYITLRYGYDNKIFTSESILYETLSKIDKLIDKKVYDHVRFIFNIPSDIENPESILNYLKERYKFNQNIKTEIVHGYIEEKRQKQKEEIRVENNKYKFLSEPIPIEEKVRHYIEIEYERKIPEERINQYMIMSLQEILRQLRNTIKIEREEEK